MPPPLKDKPHLVFLMSDTGGGHRSAVEAITEALHLEFPDTFSTEMVDIFHQYAPRPLRYAPEIYPTLSRMPTMWGLGYKASNGRRRATLLTQMFWPYVSRALRRLVHNHPCDLFVSVHQLSNAPVLRAMGKKHTPFVTVVTDMVTTHAAWYDRRADLVIVPTEAARIRGIAVGLSSEQMRVVGMPVAEKFRHPAAPREELRRALGWPDDRPLALMVGGGEGMGPLEAMAAAVDDARLPVALAVVCGRNQQLQARLSQRAWNIPMHVYGFVKNMPDMMQAADILVTKAGPGTISEGFIAGLPIILYSRLPGQEDGNVSYVLQENAGAWCPEPDQLVLTLRRWLQHPERLQRTAEKSRALARPDASRQIARLLAAQTGVFPPGSAGK